MASSTWTMGYPPENELVAIALRKWSGVDSGRYIEVVAGDPSGFLKAMSMTPLLSPGITVIHGRVVTNDGVPYVLNEYGSPTGYYPDAVLGWSRVPEFLVDMKAAAVTNMVLDRAQRSG